MDDVKFMFLFLLETGEIKMEILQLNKQIQHEPECTARIYSSRYSVVHDENLFWLQLICEWRNWTAEEYNLIHSLKQSAKPQIKLQTANHRNKTP